MKKFNISMLFMAAVLLLLSCEKQEKGPVVGVFAPPVLVAPAGGGSFVLTDSTENNTLATFTWNRADFGFPAAVIYTVEMDFSGNDFSDPGILGITGDTSLTVTEGSVNNTLLTMGAFPDVPASVVVRVTAEVHKNVKTLASEPLAMSITPFEKVIDYPKLYVPGSYQDDWNPAWSEWDPTNENTQIYSVKDDGKYEGYLYFAIDPVEMKFTKVPAWEQDNTIGDPDPAGNSGTLQIGNWGGNNIIFAGAGAGYFKVNADLVAKTYSFMKTDWGLIGDATPDGWDSDQNMTYDPVADVWTITLDLIAGSVKFRANDDWALNYGDNEGDRRLETDGANIPITEAGNYTITLDLSGAVYKYVIIKN